MCINVMIMKKTTAWIAMILAMDAKMIVDVMMGQIVITMIRIQKSKLIYV